VCETSDQHRVASSLMAKEVNRDGKTDENAIVEPIELPDSSEPVSPGSRREIGRGRSGIVYSDSDANGDQLACKVFDSRGLTKAVQWLTLGAPNPYMWNADAVECAKIRRNMLNLLVPVWTAGEMEVADASAVLWNSAQRTYELQTRFVQGRAARLNHSVLLELDDEASILWRSTMPKLRSHLASAGFDGLLWQAGIGNPVALNNFLFEDTVQATQTTSADTGNGRWVWIDLESGVPAIFPNSPGVLFQYSLAQWLRLGHPLFDDVDVDRLKDYLQSSQQELQAALGAEVYDRIIADAERLGEHQLKWKSLDRVQSSILFRLAQGDIDEQQASYYSSHRLRWVIGEAGRGLQTAVRTSCRGLLSATKTLFRIHFARIARGAWQFLISQQYREDFVHRYLDSGIGHWEERDQLSAEHAQVLRAQMGSPDSSVYVTDFGMHIALKPVIKAVQYWVFPALFAVGLISGPALAILIVTGGALGRSLYTGWRIIQSAARGTERPWIALGVGALPFVGNLAFPTQMFYSAGGKGQKLARFMMEDGFTRIGRHFPIWGGQDTWTEHAFNLLPGNIIRYWVQLRRR